MLDLGALGANVAKLVEVEFRLELTESQLLQLMVVPHAPSLTLKTRNKIAILLHAQDLSIAWALGLNGPHAQLLAVEESLLEHILSQQHQPTEEHHVKPLAVPVNKTHALQPHVTAPHPQLNLHLLQ